MFLRRVATVLVVFATTAFGIFLPTAFAGVSPHSTSYTWIGASADPPNQGDGHSWTDPLNWSPNGVPADGDSVVVAPPGPDECAAHVDNMPTVTLESLTLTVGDQCSASLDGPGAVTVTGTFSWDSGAINTPVTLAAGSSGVISQGGGTAPLKTLNADMTIDGSLTLDNVVDNGQIAQGNSWLKINAPNVLHITPTGTLTATADNDITFSACCVNPAKVINDGQVDVTDGYLHIDAVEFDQNNDVTVAKGAQLISASAPDVLAAGVHFAGGGQMVYGDHADPALNGAVSLARSFHLVLAADTESGSSGPTLGGAGSLVGYGTLDWSAGSITANLTIGHHVTVTASGGAANNTNARRFLSTATVTDHGTIQLQRHATINTIYGPNHLTIANDGVLSIAPGSKFNSYGCCVNPDTITNNGGQLVVPTASNGIAPGTPAKIVNNAYVANGGTTSIAPGEVLLVDSGAQSSLADTTVAGGGTLRNAAPVAVSGTIGVQDASRLQLIDPGSFDGTATVDGNGSFNWAGGAFSGDVTVATTGGMTISGRNEKRLNNINGGSQPSQLTVNTDATIAAGQPKYHNEIDLGYSTMTVAGSTTIANHVDVYDGTLENTGTLTIDPGSTGTVTFQYGSGRLVNRGQATLATGRLLTNDGYEQAAGTTTLAAGTKVVERTSTPLLVSGGTLTGTGSVNGNVDNAAGTLDPGTVGAAGPTGTLRISGTYSQEVRGSLALDFAASGHDRLAVQGAATLAGVLMSTTASGYAPPVGTDLQVVSAVGGRSGKFDCAFSSGTDKRWLPRYLAGQVRATRSAAGDSACDVYHPQAPQQTTTKRVKAGTDTVVNMLGQGGVPASGVSAVTMNVELSNASRAGALTVLPAGKAPVSTTTQAYDPTGPTTAQVTVALHNGKIRLHASKGAVTAAVDVVGYLTDGESTTGGRYHPLAPGRATTNPISVSATTDKQVLLAGKAGVPVTGATAVTMTVTVTNPSAASALAVTPGDVAPGSARAVLFSAGQSVSNLVTVPLSQTGRIRMHIDAGQAKVALTVLGYQTTDGTGSWLRLVKPQRLNDITLQQGYDANPQVQAATSVLVNASAINPSADATLSMGPRPDATDNVQAVQQLAAGRDLSAAATVKPGLFNEITERLSAGQSEVALDLLGYTVG